VTVGLLISIPDAIITRAYAPMLATGVIGGTLIGWAAEKWARPDSCSSTCYPNILYIDGIQDTTVAALANGIAAPAVSA
jgi:hypothetical protein